MTTLKFTAALLLALAAYLLLWPLPIDPAPWTPLPLPTGAPYAANDRLRGIQRIGEGLPGPEGIAVDAKGRVYAGLHDGRLLRFSPDFSTCSLLDRTGGRPLGLAVTSTADLLVADAQRGLLRLDQRGGLRTLADSADGLKLGFTDDVDVDAHTGAIYFSDASSKFGYGEHMRDLLDHGRHGRLLRYEPASGKTTTLLQNRPFANGVALGPNDEYLLLNETWEYRITRYWLKGSKAGQTETFVENLPGFPDNLSFNGRDRFWVALYSPREALLDRILPSPWLLKVVARMPEFARPKPKKLAHVIGLDLAGKVVADLQYAGDDAYAPITSVEEHDGWLLFGSLSDTALGRIRLEDAMRGSGVTPPPPASVSCDV